MTRHLRRWATPLVVGSFLVLAPTGVLMFLHLSTDTMKGVHELAGWAMLAGGFAHLAVNWRAFTGYLKRPAAVAVMGAGAIALGLSLMPLGTAGGPPAGMPAAMAALGRAPIGLLAQLSGRSPAEVTAALAQLGMAPADADTRLDALTGGDRGRQAEALQAIFVGPAG
jgi:hypothetical protein